MEEFITGYCRALDSHRIVTLEAEGDDFCADCAYENCPYRESCEIGRKITLLMQNIG